MASNPATSPCSCDICELMGICDKLLLFSKLLDSWVQVPVQEAIVRLMQCLLAIFKVEASTCLIWNRRNASLSVAEVPSLTAEALLSGARKLFRDPHRCGMGPHSDI